MVDTGEPFTRTGFPDESNNDTVAPATPVAVPDNVAAPVNVAPHCTSDGAETTADVDTGDSAVTLLDESVAEPDALTVIDDAVSPEIGPDPLGQVRIAVGRRHSCGESPIALTRAEAVTGPVAPARSMTKLGLCPVVDTVNDERSSGVPAATCRAVQPLMALPPESRIVNVAPVKPDVGASRVKDRQPAMELVAEQPIRGTAPGAANLTWVEPRALHPSVFVSKLYVLISGEWPVSHRQLSMIGSGVTV